jgi:hypothetical protein
MGIKELPKFLRIYCQTVSSYRAVDTGDPRKISECMGSIESVKSDALSLAQSQDVRQDRHHLLMSSSLASLHVLIAAEDYPYVRNCSAEAVKYLETIDPATLSVAFYSTSTVAAKCIGLASVFHSPAKFPGQETHYIKLLRHILALGFSNADENEVRFSEFMRAMSIFGSLTRLRREYAVAAEGSAKAKEKANACVIDVLKLCLRVPGESLLNSCERLMRSSAAT